MAWENETTEKKTVIRIATWFITSSWIFWGKRQSPSGCRSGQFTIYSGVLLVRAHQFPFRSLRGGEKETNDRVFKSVHEMKQKKNRTYSSVSRLFANSKHYNLPNTKRCRVEIRLHKVNSNDNDTERIKRSDWFSATNWNGAEVHIDLI